MVHLYINYSNSIMETSPGSQHLDCPGISPTCNTKEDPIHIGSIPTYFSIISCTISCMGSLLIFLSYYMMKEMRNVAQKIITLLTLADFFTALGYLIADYNYLTNSKKYCQVFVTICEIQSFITSWSSLCSFGWTCALALHFFLLLVVKRRSSLSTLLILQNTLIWTLPLFILLPLLVTNKLGYSPYATSNWCFIKSIHRDKNGVSVEEVVLILLGGKLWELLTYFFVISVYTVTMLKFCKHERTSILSQDGSRGYSVAHEEARSELKHRLIFIPMIFIVLRMWGTIQFFYSLAQSGKIMGGCVSKDNKVVFFVFGILQAIGDGGQGWSNAILYIFLSPKIRKQLFLYPFLATVKYITNQFYFTDTELTHTADDSNHHERRFPQQNERIDLTIPPSDDDSDVDCGTSPRHGNDSGVMGMYSETPK